MDGDVGNVVAIRLYLKWDMAVIGTKKMYLLG